MPRFLLQVTLLALIWGALPLLPASQAQAVDSSSAVEGAAQTASKSAAGGASISLREILCAVSPPSGEKAAASGSCDEVSLMPNMKPRAGTSAQDTGSSSTSTQRDFYRVEWGDTLYGLSRRFDVSMGQIKEWNGLQTNVLLAGEKLRLVPPPTEQRLDHGSSSSDRRGPKDTAATGSQLESTSRETDPVTDNSVQRNSEAASSQPVAQGRQNQSENGSPPPDPTPYEGAIPRDVKEVSPLYEKIEKAAETYRRSGHARVVVSDDGEKVYPYGEDIPTIHTAVLHVTTVELAKGEYVNSMTIGDNQRWQVNTASAGTKGDFQQHVQIKPQQCGTEGKTDMQTNLILMTNQGRTYDLMLRSLPCENRGQGRPKPDMDKWDRTVSFYYPSGRSIGPASNMTERVDRPDLRGPQRSRRGTGRSRMRQIPDSGTVAPPAPTRRVSAPRPQTRRQRVAPNPGQSGRSSRFRSDRGASGASIDLRDIETSHYEVERDRDFPCEIDLVGDDGERVYIRLADTPGCTSTYPLYEIKDRGSLQLTNYQVPNGNIYIKPGPVEKLALLYRQSDGDDSRVTITNTKIADSRRP